MGTTSGALLCCDVTGLLRGVRATGLMGLGDDMTFDDVINEPLSGRSSRDPLLMMESMLKLDILYG
jgi:hypothetical protein